MQSPCGMPGTGLDSSHGAWAMPRPRGVPKDPLCASDSCSAFLCLRHGHRGSRELAGQCLGGRPPANAEMLADPVLRVGLYQKTADICGDLLEMGQVKEGLTTRNESEPLLFQHAASCSLA